MFNFEIKKGYAIVVSNCDQIPIKISHNVEDIQRQISELIYVENCEAIVTIKNSWTRKNFGSDAKYFFHPCGCKLTITTNKKNYTLDQDYEAFIEFGKIPAESAKILACAIFARWSKSNA